MYLFYFRPVLLCSSNVFCSMKCAAEVIYYTSQDLTGSFEINSELIWINFWMNGLGKIFRLNCLQKASSIWLGFIAIVRVHSYWLVKQVFIPAYPNQELLVVVVLYLSNFFLHRLYSEIVSIQTRKYLRLFFFFSRTPKNQSEMKHIDLKIGSSKLI